MIEDRIVEIMAGCGLDWIAQLPCDKIKTLIPRVKKRFDCIDLTREEVGVGLCAGAALAGRRPAMLIQSTGAASLLNVLCSLPIYYRLPLPMLISWRGHFQEPIQAQIPLGRTLPDALAAVGIPVYRVEDATHLDLVAEGLQRAFSDSIPTAILLSPRLFQGPSSGSSAATPALQRRVLHRQLAYQGEKAAGTMKRLDAIEAAAPYLKNDAVVVNIGVPCKEYFSVADGPSVFYMLGSLGLAAAIGLGIARFTNRHVTVIDGDGSLLMTPNILQHLAQYDGGNLTVLAIDNAAYGSTGSQPTSTAGLIDLELLAHAYGVDDTASATCADTLAGIMARPDRPRFVHVLTRAGNAAAGPVGLDADQIKQRFMAWLQQ